MDLLYYLINFNTFCDDYILDYVYCMFMLCEHIELLFIKTTINNVYYIFNECLI